MNTNKNRAPRVLISGGGTGGHIFPAVAIANAIRRLRPDAEILFVGAENRMEMQRVPAAGYRIEGLPVAGFDRRRPWRNVAVLIRLARSLWRARSIVRSFRPDVAVGVGGYASGPVLKAAQRAGVPTLLQEQNSYAGVTNRLLAKRARRICVAYDGMERFFPADTIVKTGNPVRDNIASAPAGFASSPARVLVTGGSLGARTINEAVAAALPQWSAAGIRVLWQTGRNGADRYAEIAKNYPGIKAVTFIDNMADAYSQATLVVARAGAGTISELQLLAKPAVLVPSPNVAEDHQTKNAMALANAGAAVAIPDADAVALLGQTVADLVADPDRLNAMSNAIAAMAMKDADTSIARMVLELCDKDNAR